MGKINTCIVGAGSIGTALGNALVKNNKLNITLVSIEKDVIDTVSKIHVNKKYFPNFKLDANIKATDDIQILQHADYIFLALPSAVVVDYIIGIRKYINSKAPLINLAKGFGNQHKTIVECLSHYLNNPVCSLKGPTFAREMMENAPTAFTFGARESQLFAPFGKLFENTKVTLDYSEDVIGVELISILKNIYAIVIGIADARFNSPNLRFLLLTKAFKEMREIMLQFGGKEETLFKYCGFGDFSLTALNDLSRNRALGLFIGKGFFTKDISDKVLLEGKIATHIFCEKISKKNSCSNHYIIKELYKVFNNDYNISEFVDKILKHEAEINK